MLKTRATSVDDRLKHLETATEATNLQIQALTAALQQITGEVTKVNGNLQTLTAEMEQIRRNPVPHNLMPNPNPSTKPYSN